MGGMAAIASTPRLSAWAASTWLSAVLLHATWGDDNHLALSLGHHVLQHHLALLHALIDALAGGTAHIQAVYALANQVAGQAPHPLR